MKDNLFEILLNLFEKTLTQLKESQACANKNETNQGPLTDEKTLFFKAANSDSIRVFNEIEQIKLTKASYQFLMRLSTWGVISNEALEIILNQLLLSESRFIGLQETKWTIHNTLAPNLDAEQLAFLDLILYHQEDELSLH